MARLLGAVALAIIGIAGAGNGTSNDVNFSASLCPNFYLQPPPPACDGPSCASRDHGPDQCADHGPGQCTMATERCALGPEQRLAAIVVLCRSGSTSLFDYIYDELAPSFGDPHIAVARAEANLRREMAAHASHGPNSLMATQGENLWGLHLEPGFIGRAHYFFVVSCVHHVSASNHPSAVQPHHRQLATLSHRLAIAPSRQMRHPVKRAMSEYVYRKGAESFHPLRVRPGQTLLDYAVSSKATAPVSH
jgi:hypothetical protein